MRRRTFITRAAAAAVGTVVASRATLGAERPSPATSPPVAAASGARPGASPHSLLRNGDFQDDWLSLLPQNQTLHWCYLTTCYNRRDFNPDGWRCTGSWRWLDADQARGRRSLVLAPPRAQVIQRVHWVAVHDDTDVSGSPDVGGFPELRPQYSGAPARLVRDLTLRALVRGEDVPRDAGGAELGLCATGSGTLSDPLGTPVKPLATASTPFPFGTFNWQWIEVRLPAAAWLQAAAKLPDDRSRGSAPDVLLPASVLVALRFEARAGSIEVGAAELSEPGPGGPNLLPNGDFAAAGPDGYPAGWQRPAKYRYFPPKHYYLFNTWHNARFDNRGLAERDRLVSSRGGGSLKMIVPSGDEVMVASPPVPLHQREPRLIEVAATVKTDRLCMLAIEAEDEHGRRLDGFSFIHKAPVSIGTDGWRRLRQVFRPRAPVASLRLHLCARGVNGYTLDATGLQPQNNVVGTVWWEDVRVHEPESTVQELTARGVTTAPAAPGGTGPHLVHLDLGERLFGENVLMARVDNPGLAATFSLGWAFTSPSGQRSEFTSAPVPVPGGASAEIRVTYVLEEPCRTAYTEYRGRLTLLRDGRALEATDLWFSTWAVPMDLRLGALYLRPDQTQFVRVNLGISAAAMAGLRSLRLEIVRRGSGAVLHAAEIPATAAALAAQRDRIPSGLRGDLTNLLLADLDVSAVPVQPFDDPQRNWLVRATALDHEGRPVASVESEPFCRQAHESPPPPIAQVTIGRDNLLRVNGEPWMPWGGVYGFSPAYAGPANPGRQASRDLRTLPDWSVYDGFTADHYTRRDNDLNAARDVAGQITPRATIEQRWSADNRYSSTVFVVPVPVFSRAALAEKAGGQAALDAYLDFCKHAPMVVSVAPGIEEAFALFHTASPEELAGLRGVVEYLRHATGKPVMVGHGGYWNRLEFEKVPFFQIYDPETEPFYPANLHTDLWPLVRGREQVIWLRPQIYEDVPYERWRFHVYVELMRGCRGWQMAHGPGDASLMRGLHGELERLRPILASSEAPPTIRIEPWIEHWARRHRGKTYLIAATTRGIAFGHWRPGEDAGAPAGGVRITDATAEVRDEAKAFALDLGALASYAAHGIQYLPAARSWPAGSRLVQWVRLDTPPAQGGFALLVKADGRFTHAAVWGGFDLAALRGDPILALLFLRTFYPHATGFLGWDLKGLPAALPYIPGAGVAMGPSPPPGAWTRLELPLDRIRADGKLIDGVGFLHAGGRLQWGRTSIVAPTGDEVVVWGGSIALAPERLARTTIAVDGLRAGARVRALFEDREITAGDGHFVDDFRGRDLYQRFGGGPTLGYGDAPVALHVYEIG